MASTYCRPGAPLKLADEWPPTRSYPSATNALDVPAFQNGVNPGGLGEMAPEDIAFIFMTAPGQPLLPIDTPVFDNTIDDQISTVLHSMSFSLTIPNWPANPDDLRISVKYILQRICDMDSPYPLNKPQKRRVQQLVAYVDEYCRQKGLAPLPVSWFPPIPL